MGSAIRITYEPGQFSLMRLPDGTKLFIWTSDKGLHVSRVGFLNLPKEMIRKFPFPIPVPDPANPPGAVKALMEILLQSIETCQTVDEARRLLQELPENPGPRR